MWQYVTNPIAWIAVFVVSLPFWYLIFRLLFRAYYKSRMEYYNAVQQRRREHESDTERDSGPAAD
jgi:hypothetical protein